MSRTVVNYPIVTALIAAERFIGPNRQWKTVEDPPLSVKQERFLKEVFDTCRGEEIPEIESLASQKVEEINEFLRKKGFSIQLESFSSDAFGVASVLDLIVEWVLKGEVTVVETDDDRRFPGVRISEGNVHFLRFSEHKEPIACLPTKSGDRVFMTMFDQPPEGFDLVAEVEKLSHATRLSSEFGGLVFPMVDLNQEVDISWLVGLNTTDEVGKFWFVAQALQQTIFKMNEIGARVQSAVAMAFEKGIPNPDYIINRPFLIWIERDGISKPLFVGHITQEDWRNPGNLR